MSMTTDTTSLLPDEFADLVPFSDWILETQPERYQRRLDVSMAEMQNFYDVMFPRLREVMEHCNQWPMGELPDQVRNLLLLTFSLVEVSFPIEVWRQNRVPDTGAAAVECTFEPSI